MIPARELVKVIDKVCSILQGVKMTKYFLFPHYRRIVCDDWKGNSCLFQPKEIKAVTSISDSWYGICEKCGRKTVLQPF